MADQRLPPGLSSTSRRWTAASGLVGFHTKWLAAAAGSWDVQRTNDRKQHINEIKEIWKL